MRLFKEKDIYIITLIVLSCMFHYTSTAQVCPALVWSDEFEGTTLNTADWNYDTGGGGYGNNELQNYTNRTENIKVENGKLVITALQENYGSENYTSAKINTYGKHFFTYGRMEARIKLPKTQGLWPAFWMMPETSAYGGWPASGEIDIMEMKGSDVYSSYGTIHYGSNFANHKYSGGSNSGIDDLSDDFHTYAVEWKEDTISWFVDDVNFYTITKTAISPDNWPLDQDFFLILNLAVGGWFGGNPDGSTVFPQSMEVDYVRVYSNPNTLIITGANKGIIGETYEYKIENGVADSYVWTVPAGSTLVNGQGTNTINVSWGSTGGDISVDVVRGTCGVSTYTKTVHVISNGCNVIFTDSESNILMAPSSSSTGTAYDAKANNIATDAVNGSSEVTYYKRNGGDQYDVLQYRVSFLPTSVDYENGNNVLYMDVYTAAPIGTYINWQFENKARISQAYPVGRRAVFQARTTIQNGWEKLKFTLLNRPDLGTLPTEIDQFSILFNPNSYTSDAYYIDNLLRRDVLNCGLITAVENTANAQNFTLNPNPAKEQLFLTTGALSSASLSVTIVNVLGVSQLVKNYDSAYFLQDEIIDISALQSGMYLVNFKTQDGVVTSKKIIVE